MRYLGIRPAKPRVAVFDFTGCEGCELQLANKEETLGAFLGSVEIVRFREVSTEASDDYDVALIEGAITRRDEEARLLHIRERAAIVVAMGSCACFGGVNGMKNAFDLDEANREVFGDRPKDTLPTRAIKDLVHVDLEVPGCPVSKAELERVVQHLLLGLGFQFPAYPVCVECKQRFTTCMFDLGSFCLGSVTRAGCDAPCPAGGLGCWGCRGPADDANLRSLVELARKRGFSDREIDERLAFYGGFGELRCVST